VIWDELFFNNDWPMASALAVLMILLIIVPLALFQRYQAQSQESRR
jgi:putrescine transport system permease protein